MAGIRQGDNCDLAKVAENCVRRIGRTAGAGKAGAGIAFCAPGEMGELRAIQKVLKLDIPVAGGAPWVGEAESAKPGRPGASNKPGKARGRRWRGQSRRRKAA